MTITLTCTNRTCTLNGTKHTLHPTSPTPGVIAVPDYYCGNCGQLLMETSRSLTP